MDCAKTGSLLLALRREKGLTQKQLAAQLHLSDKTISKWERGLGCPDVSLLCEVGRALNVDLEKMLKGELGVQRPDIGNMKRTKFYVCPACGNILLSTGTGEVSCCGRPLQELSPTAPDAAHACRAEAVEEDWYLTFAHEMTKEHFVSFVAFVSWDRALLVRLYPEQEAAVRFPRMHAGTLYWYCSRHGLFCQPLRP